MILAAASLWRRELVRILRQRSRLAGLLATPLLFWLLVGSGFGYLDYLFSGTLVQIVLFASIFSTISLIQDRKDGFLQGVMVAPVPNAAIVLGKVLGGTTMALLQAGIFLALGPLVGVRPGPAGLLGALGMLALAAFAMTSLGVMMAWRFQSVQGFHGVMNLLLFPMWLLSGAVFPPDRAHAWVKAVMKANPLSYAVGGVRRALTGEGMDLVPAAAVVAVFGAVMFALASALARRR